MKKSVIITSTAATIGIATVLTLAAVSPSLAKTSHGTTTKPASASSAAGSNNQGGISFGATQDTRKFTSVNFTVSNIPSTITDAATAAKLLVVKVVPLAADATAAPATAPLPAFGANGPKRDGDGDGPGFGGAHGKGGWTAPTTGATPAPSTSSSTAPVATSPATPPAGATPPSFGGDNDGDGPRGGHGRGPGKGGFGGPRGPQFSNLTLTNGVLTGTIQLPGDEVAGSQKFGIYLSVAASSANNIAAQSATPVMVTVTTAADLTPTVSASTGSVAITLK